MSSGLYSGVSGLTLGVGLYKGTQGLWSGASGLITGGGGQTLALNFLAGAPLDSRITFTRASTATFVGSNGLTQTAAVDTPRFDYDPVTLAPKGILIEEQRTNLVTYSAQFDNGAWAKNNTTITANSTVAPDGTTTGDTVTGVVPGSTNNVTRSITAAATQYTYSIWVMAGTATTCVLLLRDNTTPINLSSSAQIISGPGSVSGTSTITVTGLSTTQWTRVAITTTAAMTAGNLLGVFFYPETSVGGSTTAKSNMIWGAQVEAGAFATSYIPTVASQVTRSADIASMTGTNFSSWYNQTEGTFVGSFDAFSPASSMVWAGISDGTSNNRMQSGSSSGSALFVNVGGVNQVALSSSTVTANTITNRAITYKTDDFAVCTAGGSVATDTLGTLPTVDRLAVGGLNSGSQLNGHIRSIDYYNTRLPDAQLQSLTA